MSVASIRAALETRLNAMSPALATAWQNDRFVPVSGTPYQRVDILYATPENTEMGGTYREQGYLQVRLLYPLGAGSAAAEARAQAIRAQFPRALSLTSGGVVVVIQSTPAIGSGSRDDDRWSVPVKVFFRANL